MAIYLNVKYEYLSLYTSCSNCTIPGVLTGPENINIAVGMSMLYCVHAEKYVGLFVVRGRHLGFSTATLPGGSSVVPLD